MVTTTNDFQTTKDVRIADDLPTVTIDLRFLLVTMVTTIKDLGTIKDLPTTVTTTITITTTATANVRQFLLKCLFRLLEFNVDDTSESWRLLKWQQLLDASAHDETHKNHAGDPCSELQALGCAWCVTFKLYLCYLCDPVPLVACRAILQQHVSGGEIRRGEQISENSPPFQSVLMLSYRLNFFHLICRKWID